MSAVQDLPVQCESKVVRPIADFSPNIWGDQFVNFSFDEKIYESGQKEIEELKKVVREEILVIYNADHEEAIRKLKSIDEVQRLGVAHHFEKDIEKALTHIYDFYPYYQDDNLYNVSLSFRLLRQQGFRVSSEIFNKFQDEKGKFKSSLVNDVDGMLSLYEAAQLRIRGEDILDEALAFTTKQLEYILSSSSIMSNSASPNLADIIRHSLNQQLRKGIEKLEAKYYMSVYQDMTSHNKTLLKLAKLDFNLSQTLYRKELSDLIRWWKELGLREKLTFARDRLVESYVLSVVVFPQAQYSFSRRLMTKEYTFLTFIDDIYDAYGTIGELILFTDAIERWDINNDQLPKCMKLCLEALFAFRKEDVEDEMTKQGNKYVVQYVNEGLKKTVRPYFKKARWLVEKYLPSTLEEYLEVGIESIGVLEGIAIGLAGMNDDIVTKDTFEWLFTPPKILTASSSIGRLMNDIAGHKFEQKRGHVGSSVECYMKQHGVSEKEAYDELNKILLNCWKDINEEHLKPTAVPKRILDVLLKFNQCVDVAYKNEDYFTDVGPTKKFLITTLLIDQI